MKLELSKINVKDIDPKIKSELMKQIERDFLRAGYSFRFTDKRVKSVELKNQLDSILLNLKEPKSKLLQLLYIIDVPEKQFKELLAVDDYGEFIEAFSTVILKREIQKVLIRRYYASMNQADSDDNLIK